MPEPSSSRAQRPRSVCGVGKQSDMDTVTRRPLQHLKKLSVLFTQTHHKPLHTFHFTVFNFTTKPACTDVRLINFSLHIPPGALKDTSGSYYSQFLQSKPLFIHQHWPLRDKPGLQGQGTCGYLLISNTSPLRFYFQILSII